MPRPLHNTYWCLTSNAMGRNFNTRLPPIGWYQAPWSRHSIPSLPRFSTATLLILLRHRVYSPDRMMSALVNVIVHDSTCLSSTGRVFAVTDLCRTSLACKQATKCASNHGLIPLSTPSRKYICAAVWPPLILASRPWMMLDLPATSPRGGSPFWRRLALFVQGVPRLGGRNSAGGDTTNDTLHTTRRSRSD